MKDWRQGFLNINSMIENVVICPFFSDRKSASLTDDASVNILPKLSHFHGYWESDSVSKRKRSSSTCFPVVWIFDPKWGRTRLFKSISSVGFWSKRERPHSSWQREVDPSVCHDGGPRGTSGWCWKWSFLPSGCKNANDNFSVHLVYEKRQLSLMCQVSGDSCLNLFNEQEVRFASAILCIAQFNCRVNSGYLDILLGEQLSNIFKKIFKQESETSWSWGCRMLGKYELASHSESMPRPSLQRETETEHSEFLTKKDVRKAFDNPE